MGLSDLPAFRLCISIKDMHKDHDTTVTNHIGDFIFLLQQPADFEIGRAVAYGAKVMDGHVKAVKFHKVL